MYFEILLSLLLFTSHAQQQTQCKNEPPLTADVKEAELKIGEGSVNVEKGFKCEWKIQTPSDKNGLIMIKVVGSQQGQASLTECVDVTTVPPQSENRNPTKLCADQSNTEFAAAALTAYVIYPATGVDSENKPFKVSYKLDTTALNNKCNSPPTLMADTEVKQFPVGNGAQDLGADFSCEWTIQPLNGKTGSIVITVNASTVQGGKHTNECVDVTTVPPNNENRNPTKVCAEGSNKEFRADSSAAYVIYPATSMKSENKPFMVSYKLDNTQLNKKCDTPAPLMADIEAKDFNVGNGEQDLGAGYSCEWTIQTDNGKTGSIVIFVNGSTVQGGTHSNECVDVTTVPSTSANRNLTKLCAEGGSSTLTSSESPIYVIYPATKTDANNKPFKVTYKLNSSGRLGITRIIFVFAAVAFKFSSW